MSSILRRSSLSAAIALSLIACGVGGSGGGGLAGIGGSGFISSGSITGFGSVIVNGVIFHTDDAVFDLEGITGTKDEMENLLSKGMRVQISGSIDANGNGVASKVVFDDQLEGPLHSVINVDTENKTFTILGVSVKINSIDTVFVGTTFNFASITNSFTHSVQISGFYDANGILRATAIVKKDDFAASSTQVEAQGSISNLTADSFTLTVGTASSPSNELIITAGAADLSALANAQIVEVTGTISTTTATTVSAIIVKPDDTHPAEGEEVEIEGTITNFDSSANTFKIDDISIDASAPTLHKIPASLVLDNGIRIEVEGAVVNGVLHANEILLREGSVEMEAIATDATSSSFNMNYHSGTVSVSVDNHTLLEDKTTDDSFSLAELVNKVNSQFLKVRGIENGANSVIATHISIESLPDPVNVKLQGIGSSNASNETVTVLGIAFNTNSNTEFEGANDEEPETHAEFHPLVLPTTILEIEDDDNDGIADEIEIEEP